MRLERTIRHCEECGVEFIGLPRQKLCPMHLLEHTRACQRDVRKYRKYRGLCYDCGRPVEEGKTRCSKCLAKIRAAYRKKNPPRDESRRGRSEKESTVIISRDGGFDNEND